MIPLSFYTPLRYAAVRLRRRNPLRVLCVPILKFGQRSYRLQLADRLAEIRPLDAPDFSFQPTDSMVMDAVYWFGVRGYEGKLADVWVELCGQARSILEIGGNVGLFTTIGGRAAQGDYTVVEPVPQVANVLRANLARNGLCHVRVIEGAAIPAMTPQTVRLSVPNEQRAAPVGAHLEAAVEVFGRGSWQVLDVDGIPAADLFEGRDLIKIDAEGIEAELLKAADGSIRRNRPSLLIEVLPEAIRLGDALAQYARELGYTISIVPAYGSGVITTVAPNSFSSDVPRRYNSKDVLLSVTPLESVRAARSCP